MLLALVAAAGGYALFNWWKPIEVEFTRAAAPALPAIEVRAPVSTAYVNIPVNLARVARRAEAAFSERLRMGLDAPDPACARRPSAAECSGVKVDHGLALAGNAEASAGGGIVRVRLPFKFDVTQGADRASVESAVTFAWRVRNAGSAEVEISRVEDTAPDAAAGPHGRTIRALETRLRPLALSAQDELRVVLGELRVAAATEHAWKALSQPIDLGGKAWLKASPEVAGTGDLATIDNATVYRIPIAARLTLEAGERPAAGPRSLVTYGQVNTAGGAVLRVATPIGFGPAQAAIEAAFVRGGTLETRPDRFGPPVKVDVKKTRLYPSLRTLAVELEVAASRFEGQVYHGKAHLVGRPVLDAERHFVTLTDINLPPPPQREGTVGGSPATAPRLAADPFAGRLAAAFRIDIAQDAADTLPRANGMLQRRIDDRLTMAALLEKATPVSFEVARDGGWLLVDLAGALAFGYEGASTTTPVAGLPQRPVESAAQPVPRKTATPELAPAAVVGAAAAVAAGAIAGQAARPAAGGVAQSAATPAFIAPPAPATSAVAPAASAPAVPAPAASALSARPGAPRQTIARTQVPRTASAAKRSGNQVAATGRGNWVPFPTNN